MLSSSGYKNTLIDMCQSYDYHVIVMWLLWLHGHSFRYYAIDVITLLTKHETDSGRQAGHYITILSWSVSTAEQFASSFLTSTRSDFIFLPRMELDLNQPNAHRSD